MCFSILKIKLVRITELCGDPYFRSVQSYSLNFGCPPWTYRVNLTLWCTGMVGEKEDTCIRQQNLMSTKEAWLSLLGSIPLTQGTVMRYPFLSWAKYTSWLLPWAFNCLSLPWGLLCNPPTNQMHQPLLEQGFAVGTEKVQPEKSN